MKKFNLTKHPRRVPKLSAFQRAINRFNETASAKPSSGGGSEKSVRTPQNILRVKDAIDNDTSSTTLRRKITMLKSEKTKSPTLHSNNMYLK